MSRRPGRGGRPRQAEHRGGPRPHEVARGSRPVGPVEPAEAGGSATAEAALERVREGRDSGYDPIRDARPQRAVVVAPSVAVELAPAPTRPLEDALRQPIGDGGLPSPVERDPERNGTCTTAQLRRFIKSRAYIPMHEIRRRFAIAAEDDDVTGIVLGSGRIFVGLPPREATMLGELFRAGEVGYELQLDPIAPVVVGVYPMRPIIRS
jgi:hypothetical protein